MVKRAIIRLGDPTSHGGTVLEAFPTLNIYGKNASGIGHHGYCPSCKRDFVIVAGAASFTYFGQNIALEGMQTSCGAVLIATQHQATVDDASGYGSSPVRGVNVADFTDFSAHETQAFDQQFRLMDKRDVPMSEIYYTAKLPTGELVYGVTDRSGLTERFSTPSAQEIQIYLGHRESV